VRVDRPDPADESGDVGMAGNARPFDEPARAGAVYRQYDIDNDHGTAKSPDAKRSPLRCAVRRPKTDIAT
jgi:hypothetical protein